jgi:O-antigen/teichoic acid export membrane protein
MDRSSVKGFAGSPRTTAGHHCGIDTAITGERALLNHLYLMVSGQGLRSQLVRAGFAVGGLKLTAILLGIVSSAVLARGLGPDWFGRYAFVVSVVTVLAIPVDQGMRQLATREVAAYLHGNSWGLLGAFFRRADQWTIVLATAVSAILGLLAIPQATWTATDRWTLLAVGLLLPPLWGLCALRGAVLRGLGHVVNAQVPEFLVRPSLLLVTALGLQLIGLLNPFTALVAQCVAAAFALCAAAIAVRHYWPEGARRTAATYDASAWLNAWIPFTLISGAAVLNSQLGVLFLGITGNDVGTGAIAIAARGAQLVSVPLVIVNLVIAPQVTRAYRDSDQQRMRKLYLQSARVTLLLALPVATPLIFWGEHIISLLFGGRYAPHAAIPMAILAASQMFNVAMGSVGLFLTMSGHERDALHGQLIALAINLLLCASLVPFFGATGAAIAAAAGVLVWNVMLAVKLMQRLRLRPGFW